MIDPWQRLERDFNEQLAGITPPRAPEPLPVPAMPVPEWPTNEGREL